VRHNSAPAPPPQPAAPSTALPPARSAAEVSAAARAPAPPPEPAVAPDARTPRVWRVIAFTYNSQSAADKKVRSINERWPDFHAEVFSLKTRRAVYLVALGGRMTREDAASLLRRARAAGLPRDAYIQNYAE